MLIEVPAKTINCCVSPVAAATMKQTANKTEKPSAMNEKTRTTAR